MKLLMVLLAKKLLFEPPQVMYSVRYQNLNKNRTLSLSVLR